MPFKVKNVVQQLKNFYYNYENAGASKFILCHNNWIHSGIYSNKL